MSLFHVERELFFTYAPETKFELNRVWRDSTGKRWRMTRCVPVGLSNCFKVLGVAI